MQPEVLAREQTPGCMVITSGPAVGSQMEHTENAHVFWGSRENAGVRSSPGHRPAMGQEQQSAMHLVEKIQRILNMIKEEVPISVARQSCLLLNIEEAESPETFLVPEQLKILGKLNATLTIHPNPPLDYYL